MNDDTLIKVEGVSKKFCRNLKKSLLYGMKDLGNELFCRLHTGDEFLRQDEFWAVKDVSFKLERGECIGLIGRNGAGKTSLLRMLSGLIKPDKGRIEIKGRIGALIALGAGFNPVLTGRENIYVNAAVLGLGRKDVDRKFDDIVAFAELEDFIDTPVQSYSSGMTVRLGFAVATALNPDVLLLDEVLAVGDTRFQAKCFKRIRTILDGGGLILLVTHTLEHVANYCDRALLMDRGEILVDGGTSEALAGYIEQMGNHSELSIPVGSTDMSTKPELNDEFHKSLLYNPNETRWGDRAAAITDACLVQENQDINATIVPGLLTELKLKICFYADIEEPIYGVMIKAAEGGTVFGTNSRQLLGPLNIPSQKAGDQLQISFSFKPFLDAGEYFISVGIASEVDSTIQPHDRRYDSIKFKIEHPLSPTGDIAMQPSFRILG